MKKLKKALSQATAAILASAMCTTAFAQTAESGITATDGEILPAVYAAEPTDVQSADNVSYTATAIFADIDWLPYTYNSSTVVTGDGTYSITISNMATFIDEETGDEITQPAVIDGVTMLLIDIADLGKDLGIEPEGYDMSKCTVSDVRIMCGSREVAVDQSKIRWCDLNGNGNLTIEIYNEFVQTNYDPPINPDDIHCDTDEALTVQFTISGIDEALSREPLPTSGDFQYLVLDDGTTSIVKYTGTDSTVTVPASIEGKAVTEIGNFAFYRNDTLQSITIPDSVASIGAYAFYCCEELKAVSIPYGVTSIEEHTFEGCYKLQAVTLPDSLTSIKDSAFAACFSLSAIIFPNSLTSIGQDAFSNCILEYVTIPAGVTSIGKNAFSLCDNLKLYCYSGTAAETYAKENGITYTLLTPAPKAVTSFTLGGRASGALRLNWDKNATADGYIIEQYKDGKWVRIAKIKNNATTTYRVTGLSAGTVYKFRMKAYKMNGLTALYSDYTATLPARTDPSDITGLKLGGRSADALRLNWTKNASADGYIIEQYKSGKWVRIAKIAGNATTTYRVTGLSAGTDYKFRMKAYKMSGSTALYSGYTATLAARTNPSNVTGVKISGKASTALRLNWTKNTSADGYIVEFYKGGKWVRAAKITNNATVTYRISGLAKNTTYKIRIKAYKMSGSTALYSGYTTISGKTTA